MKKIILMLAIMIAAATNITAKGANMAFGVDYNYSSKGGGSGVGFQLEYELIKNLRIAPEFIYTFSTDDCGHFTNVRLKLSPAGIWRPTWFDPADEFVLGASCWLQQGIHSCSRWPM